MKALQIYTNSPIEKQNLMESSLHTSRFNNLDIRCNAKVVCQSTSLTQLFLIFSQFYCIQKKHFLAYTEAQMMMLLLQDINLLWHVLEKSLDICQVDTQKD